MRKRLLGGVLAVCLAVPVAVGGTARPAKADPAVWINVAVAVAGKLFGGGGGGGGDLEQAKREILAAISASQQDILNHIDAIAAADVRACLRSGTLLMPNIDQMDVYTLPVFMENSINCATRSSAYFDAVQDLSAADNIARLMGEIYSIAMISFEKMGFDSTYLLDDLIGSYEAVLNKVKPACGDDWQTWNDNEWGFYTEHRYHCQAFNGDSASWMEYWYGSNVENPIDHAWVESEAMRNTVRPHVVQTLAQLKQIRAGV